MNEVKYYEGIYKYLRSKVLYRYEGILIFWISTTLRQNTFVPSWVSKVFWILSGCDTFWCITILYNNVKTLSLRSTQSLQWANSIKIPLIYVHVSDLSLLTIYNQVKLRTLKVSHPDEIQNTLVKNMYGWI